MGRLDSAIADYSKAIELNSDDASLYAARGFVYLKKGDKDGAVADFSKAIEMKPDAAYYEARAYLYDGEGDTEKEIGDVTRLITFKPSDTSLVLRRADLYMKLKRYDEALADYEQVLTGDPKSIPALAGKGEVIAKKGDRRGGAAQLQEALQLTSDPKEKEYIQAKLREIGVGPL